MMDYYKIIEGRKYDRQLLESADLYTTGVGDGHFSQNDAQEIYQEAYDRGRITDVERQTLFYILDHYHFTDKADQWLRKKLGPPGQSMTSLESSIKAILDSFGIPELTLHFQEAEIEKQMELFRPQVDFTQTLEKALDSFMNQSSSPESPRAMVIETHELFIDRFDNQSRLSDTIQEKMIFYLKMGQMNLIPYDKVINYDEIDYTPSSGGV
ncbi:MAG: hypothetical protein AAFU64_11130 [Bacteroidota bacterium]